MVLWAIVARSAPFAPHRVFGLFCYDASGNVTAYLTNALAYDDAGRLRTFVNATARNFDYNAQGQRVRKRPTSTTATYFVYDEAGHLIGEYDTAGAMTQELVWLGAIPVASVRPKSGGGVNIFYIHTDHLNAPRLISQASDNKLRWRWDRHPFGTKTPVEALNGLGTFSFNLRLPGQYYDGETGLHQNHFRDYAPAIGRYLQSDPIGVNAGPNLYAYVDSNPVAHIDPRGLD